MIIVNVAAFTYSMYQNHWRFESFSDNPTFGPSAAVLDDLGAKDSAKIRAGEWWRFITAAFLHAGIIHIVLNLNMIWRLGGNIEQGFGWWRLAVIYLTSSISGNLLSAVFLPLQISIGASGALFGLIGSLFGDFLHNYRLMEGSAFCYLLNLIVNAAFGLAIGLLPIVDNWAHLGGFVGGFLMGSIVLIDPHHNYGYQTKTKPWYSTVLILLSSVCIILWFIVLSWIFIWNSDPNRICSWCRYLDCIETPFWTCCTPQVDRSTGKVIPC